MGLDDGGGSFCQVPNLRNPLMQSTLLKTLVQMCSNSLPVLLLSSRDWLLPAGTISSRD